jgi:tetratricopeptide (TPR) repeat protein
MRRRMIVTVTFVAALLLLSVNYGVERLFDESEQVAQWASLSWRGGVAMMVMTCVCMVGIGSASQMLILGLRDCKSRRTEEEKKEKKEKEEKKGIYVDAIAMAVVVAGVVESVLGLMQLYGYVPSGHGLFKLTGTFYNPGPLGGYIAVCVPVALQMATEARNEIVRWTARVTMVVMLVVLPSTMSRTAWVAAAIGCGYVMMSRAGVREKVREIVRKRRWIVAAGAVLVIAAGAGLWVLKGASAYGRLFMWRMSARAVAAAPIVGHGEFARAYAEAQETYFASGEATAADESAAICPPYAFNEYLDMAVRHGVPMTVVVLLILAAVVWTGHRGGANGAVGGIVTLAVFSFASYPMHVPAFVAMGVALAVSCVMAGGRRWVSAGVCGVVAIGCWAVYPRMGERLEAMREWEKVRRVYTFNMYEAAAREYEPMYERMRWNGAFLYEYGHALHKTGEYRRSNEVLKEAGELMGDPMILNIMGKNYMEIGEYSEAERCLRRSVARMPNRMYPHYLLFTLYGRTGDVVRQREEGEKVLTMEVKVESPAVEEMRGKVKLGIRN